MSKMTNRLSAEVRAVRLGFDHEKEHRSHWAAEAEARYFAMLEEPAMAM